MDPYWYDKIELNMIMVCLLQWFWLFWVKFHSLFDKYIHRAVTIVTDTCGLGMGILSRWWFQIFFIFTPIWGNDPI